MRLPASCLVAPFLLALVLVVPVKCFGQEPPAAPSLETELVPVSPKAPWGDLSTVPVQAEPSAWREALLYLPNRLLDLLDIFRVDVGVGPSFGGVVRVTEYGQAGYRQMMPLSLRVGDFGRQFPGMVETSNEFGVGPLFAPSADRKVCPGEVGLGADLFVAGAYGGVCLDEVVDFVAGIFLVDVKDDDLQ